jgi:hypothetical protein
MSVMALSGLYLVLDAVAVFDQGSAGAHDQQRHAQVDHAVASRYTSTVLKRLALDLARGVGQLGHAHRHGEAGVLEQLHGVVHQRGQRDARACGSTTRREACRYDRPMRTRSLQLRLRNRPRMPARSPSDTYAAMHRPDGDECEQELAVVRVEPLLHGVRQQRRHAEIPEKDLHQHRHVLVVLDVAGHARRAPRLLLRHAHHGEHGAHHHGKHPRYRL